MTPVKFDVIMPAAMHRFLRRALTVFLLAVAVPWQGYAAAGMDLCRALAHPGEAAAASHAQPHDVSAHPMHDTPNAPAGATTHDEHACAACASCGVAAAIAAFPASHATGMPDRGVAVAHARAPAGHVPEALDRPPLALLA